MILTSCFISNLNLTAVKENIVSSCQTMRTGCIYCSSILNVATHLQRAYVQNPISEDILCLEGRSREVSQGTYPEGRYLQSFPSFKLLKLGITD